MGNTKYAPVIPFIASLTVAKSLRSPSTISTPWAQSMGTLVNRMDQRPYGDLEFQELGDGVCPSRTSRTRDKNFLVSHTILQGMIGSGTSADDKSRSLTVCGDSYRPSETANRPVPVVVVGGARL